MATRPRSARRKQRREVFAAWRAVPYRRRVEIVKAAKAGKRHPDEAAVQAAQRFAAFCIYPQGDRPRSPRTRLVAAWAALPLGLVLVGEGVLMHRLDSPTIVVVAFAALGLATMVYGVYWIDLLRESRRLLAVPEASETSPRQSDDPVG